MHIYQFQINNYARVSQEIIKEFHKYLRHNLVIKSVESHISASVYELILPMEYYFHIVKKRGIIF